VRFAQTHLNHPKVILYGQSMGAAAVLRAVQACNVRPDGIIVEGVFDKMLNTVRNRFRAMGVPSFPSAQLLVFWGGCQAGFNGFGHNPADYARSVKCPILFLHGTADPRARIEEARRIFEAVPGVKRFQEFSGVRHEAAIVRFRTQWGEAVGQFLLEVEKKPEAAKPATASLFQGKLPM
jgi:pimeloyl-ACP methyl ester carboxylesterase